MQQCGSDTGAEAVLQMATPRHSQNAALHFFIFLIIICVSIISEKPSLKYMPPAQPYSSDSDEALAAALQARKSFFGVN